MLCVVSALGLWVLGQTPEHLGQRADADVTPVQTLAAGLTRLPGKALWHSRAFLTLWPWPRPVMRLRPCVLDCCLVRSLGLKRLFLVAQFWCNFWPWLAFWPAETAP